MSVSSLPEWKQLLLERKRREEEQRERREKEEEEKLASMPAWKRGIIQRRKANSITVNLGKPKPGSQVSMETIVPVHENPFIRTQSVWRKGKDLEAPNEVEGKLCVRSQEVEVSRGRDIELKIERFRDLSEGHSGPEREIPRSPKKIPPLEVQIPRTVFYVAEEMAERKGSECRSVDGQDWEGGQRVERRDSWRIGKPLSRIESLREKIRQRELDKQREREARVGDGCEAADVCDAPAEEDRYEVRGSEVKKEWEAVAVQTRLAEPESVKGEAAEQTCTGVYDVRREVGVLKTSPQLPVSVLSSQDSSREEVAGERSASASEGSQISEDEVKEAEETPDLNPKESPQHLCSPTSQQKQTITINSSVSRTQSPDNFLKPTNCAPTPASSPCSPSPASSPSISPSPSASPKLFTIKSASGGPVKRGSAKAPPEQPMSPTVDEPSKKKYPMVEEIEVIGGYQNLERSCLVKSKVTPKRVSFSL
uniref:Phostensin/Taperin PP1-binding domain-containing protein n=1 Tax=Poecilia mexicana TaxID=48701 RepID=A0A3B3WMX5_9TELE